MLKPMRNMICILAVMMALPLAAQTDTTYDRLQVHFDRPVAVSKSLTLQPGDYIFQEVQSSAEANTFHVYRASDKKAMGNTAVANAVYAGGLNPTPQTTSKQTQVEVVRAGGKDFLDKLWFEGQNQGYSFDVGQKKAIEQASAMASNQNRPGEVVRILIPAIIPVAVVAETGTSGSSMDQSASTSSAMENQQSSASALPESDQGTDVNSSANAGQSSTAPAMSSDKSMKAKHKDKDKDMSSSTMKQGSYSSDTTKATNDDYGNSQNQTTNNSDSNARLPQSDQGTSSKSSDRQIVGCVTGPYGGSYMLTTSSGEKYELRGDYDNVREYVNRTVTIWASPDSGTSSMSQSGNTGPMDSTNTTGANNNQTMNNSQTMSQSNNSTAGQNNRSNTGSNAGMQPQIVSVNRVMLKSEQCDRSMMK